MTINGHRIHSQNAVLVIKVMLCHTSYAGLYYVVKYERQRSRSEQHVHDTRKRVAPAESCRLSTCLVYVKCDMSSVEQGRP